MELLSTVLLAASLAFPSHAPVSKPPQQVVQHQDARRAQLEIIAATLELRDRYPDFERYEGRIAELSEVFLPGKSVSPLTYLEGLYFIAKSK